MTLRDWKLRLHALLLPRRVERELEEELAFHIARETEQNVASGIDRVESRRRARARFGSTLHVADECRDARGIRFVDESVRDILYALRTFRRAPLAALTIVITIAVGLGLVATVFTFLNVLVFRVDRLPNPQELFAVERTRLSSGQPVSFVRPQYESLRRETTVFSDVFGMLPDIDSRIDGRMMAGTLVTGNFFDVLGVKPVLGRAITPADDERFAGRPVVVLSNEGWTHLFASDPTVIGRRLVVSGFSFEVIGVMPEGFRGLSVGSPDYWAPLSLLGQFRPFHAGHEEAVAIHVVGRLRPGLSRQSAVAGLVVWNSGAVDDGVSITLEPRNGTISQPAEALLLFSPLFLVFGLILAIGCANVANLLLARGLSRQRELGVGLALGASRLRIIRQLLLESLLLALGAAAVGFVVSRLTLYTAIHAIMNTMAPEFVELLDLDAPAADWRVVVFLIGGAMLSTVLFALTPALNATRLELVRTMRGEVMRDAPSGRPRNALIAIQVTASALLLVCSAIFLAQCASGLLSRFRVADSRHHPRRHCQRTDPYRDGPGGHERADR